MLCDMRLNSGSRRWSKRAFWGDDKRSSDGTPPPLQKCQKHPDFLGLDHKVAECLHQFHVTVSENLILCPELGENDKCRSFDHLKESVRQISKRTFCGQIIKILQNWPSRNILSGEIKVKEEKVSSFVISTLCWIAGGHFFLVLISRWRNSFFCRPKSSKTADGPPYHVFDFFDEKKNSLKNVQKCFKIFC